MIREDDIARAQQSTQTREQVIAEAKQGEKLRWKQALNHPRADELKTMIVTALTNSDMAPAEIHRLIEKVPLTEGAAPPPATALDEAMEGMRAACAILGRDPVPIDQSLLPFAAVPQLVIDQDEYERGAAEARKLLSMCGIEGVRAKPPTPAEISGSSGLGASYDRFPSDQARAAGEAAALRVKAMMRGGQ